MKCLDCRHFDGDEKGGVCMYSPPMAALIPIESVGGRSLAVVSYRPEIKNPSKERCSNFRYPVE